MTPKQNAIIELWKRGKGTGVRITYVQMAAIVGCTEAHVSKTISTYLFPPKKEDMVQPVECICAYVPCRKRHFVNMIYNDVVPPRIYCPEHEYMRHLPDDEPLPCGGVVRRIMSMEGV